MTSSNFRTTLLFSILLLLSASVYGQSYKGMDTETYRTQHDSLTMLKINLLSLKEKSHMEIDSLSNHLNDLKEQLQNNLRELYILKYGKQNGSRIFLGQVWIGMTERMLKDSWGDPDKIDKNMEKWGVFTQWYYGNITYFFKNGKLIAWEEENNK